MRRTIRVSAAGLLLALGACAGAFNPRSEPIDLGPDTARTVSISVEGPSDMPEWGALLWAELAQTLSGTKGVTVVEQGPADLAVEATVETWDYEGRMEVQEPQRFGRSAKHLGLQAGADHYRQCTALMGVAIEIRDATGKVLAERKYLGVERGTQDLPFDKFQAPKGFMRRAAGKVAAQLAEDLEKGRKAAR